MVAVLAASVTAQGQPAGKGAAGSKGAAPAAPAPDPKVAELEKHFYAGQAFAQKKQWAKAVEELAKAFEIGPLPQIAGNLGEAELQIGRFRDAAEHVDFYLRKERPSEIRPDERKAAEGWLAKAKKEVATLKITVTLPGAAEGAAGSGAAGGGAAAVGGDTAGDAAAAFELFVDGKKVATSPLSPEVYVEPGKHTIAVRAGTSRDEVTGQFEKGTEQEIKLTPKEPVVGPAATATASATGNAGEPVGNQGGPRMGIVIGGGVAAGVAAVAGAVMLGLYFGKAGEVQSLQTSLGKDRVPCEVDNPSPDCEKLKSAARGGNALAAGWMWSFIGAGVAGAATVGYWLIVPKKQVVGNLQPVRAGAVVSPTAGKLVLEGSW